jgi:preprotein translocase subunit YajC
MLVQALVLIPLVAIPFFLLFVLPQRRQLRAVAEMQARIVPGDEIVTTSGIFGHIVSLGVDTAELQIAPATTITIARRAIGRLVADLPPTACPSVIELSDGADVPSPPPVLAAGDHDLESGAPAEQPGADPSGERRA